MQLRIAARALAAALLCATSARAQELKDLGYVEFSDNGWISTGPQGVPAPDGQKAPAQPGPRMQKLPQLDFDRRPSAMLAAWAKLAAAKPGEAAPASSETQPPDASQLARAEPPSQVTSVAASGVAVSVAVGVTSVTSVASAPTSAASTQPAQPVATEPPAVPESAAKAAEAEAAAKAAADAAAKAAEDARKQAEEQKAIDEELKGFQRNVTLGDWAAVKATLASWKEDEQRLGYDTLLRSLHDGPRQRPQVPPQGQQHMERNVFSPTDVLGLAAAAPLAPNAQNLQHLGQLLRQSLDQGHQLASFLEYAKAHVDDAEFGVDRRRLAQILVFAGQAEFIEGLLPSLTEAEAKGDREGLNLISRWCLAKHEKDPRTTWLEQAWRATQAALSAGEVSEEAKGEAITRAVELAPKLRAELGAAWLDESFTARPERGMEILAAIGTAASTALSKTPMDSERREKLLELQTTAAKALLAAAPERAAAWRPQLGLLAANWLREATFSYQFDDSTSLGPKMQRDMYGNYFYWDGGWNGRGNMPTPIRTGKVLEYRPGDEWIAHLEPTLQPRLRMAFAQLYLKVGEETDAFPYIEELARTDPVPAKSLVDEFLRVWAKNHDPNQQQNRNNPYIYMYGFDERANAIPLTRSKQERALAELGGWVERLRALPVELDQKLVAAAFRAAHSSAEVFRLETLEQIFGSLDALEPATLAELVGAMRVNLVSVWRDPALQKDKQTQRKQKDIEQEVLRGYGVARDTVTRALEGHPASWELWNVRAALEHDENEFRRLLGKDSEYSARRAQAFESFARAAELYSAALPDLELDKETTAVYETWFYAALGACDLPKIDHRTLLAADEIPKLKAALAALPAERAERHLSMFGNALTTRIGSANPAIKFRYVRNGLAVTGATKITRELQQLDDYYRDLVTEIQLRATVEGSTQVGHGAPFGLRVDLRHTREIERESGGFAKYLQNQNAQNFAYNYGRPLEDYRDKFEESAREALKERFDVLSITFNQPEAGSKPDPETGWRVTPYAYLLLKPRGPEVDRVPPLKLDLDFLDTSGYCVLPIESAPLVIDAQEPRGEPRPFERLALTQTLDERQAKTGKLVLEVKASAEGLVPDLDQLLDLKPEGFDIAARDERGVSISKFDDDGEGVLSERLWTVTLTGRKDLAQLPERFAFGTPTVPVESSEHFRYVDADLATVGPVVELEYHYGEERRSWPYWLAGALALGAGAFFALRGRRAQAEVSAAPRIRVPDPLTPFSTLAFLREVESAKALPPERHRELASEIETLERAYFGDANGSERPDLAHIAHKWAATV